MRYFLSVTVWGSMYTPSTFHNSTPSKAKTVRAKTSSYCSKVILSNRSTLPFLVGR